MARYNYEYLNHERDKIEEANRIEELENLVENHTRTDRHLEQHFDITSPERIHDAIEKQSQKKL
jgi:hypothetical protein